MTIQLVTYRTSAAEDWSAGLRVGVEVVDAAAALGRSGRLSVKEILQAGLAEELAGKAAGAQRRLPAESVELGPPVPDPDKILCVGLNYRDHAVESGLEAPPAPVLFAKFRNALVGPTAPIRLIAQSSKVDYEGELAVVIGRRCRRVSEAEALAYVVGYSVMNDVSARDIQLSVSQWTAGKAIDGFAPMGPGIALAGEVGDPQRLQLTTLLNGEVMQQASTASMIFSVAQLISYISGLITLEPGDIIATGTPSGVGQSRTPPVFLKPGDVVEVEVGRVGAIRNSVVAPN